MGAAPAGVSRAEGADERAAPRWREGVLAALAGWVLARVCVTAGHLLAHGMLDVLDTPRGDQHLREGLVTWDGTWYRVLAEQWYGSVDGSSRFFPVYPGLGRVLAPLVGGREDVALVVVNNLAALAGAVLLWRLVVEALGDRPCARRAAWMVAVFPSAFSLVFAYSEGLALVAVCGVLLALQRRSFVAAGAIGAFAAMVRPVGGLVVAAIAVELLRQRPRPRPVEVVVGLVGPVLGLVAAMAWIAASTGDWWEPVRIQQEIRGGFQDPLTRVVEPVGEALKGDFRDVYNLGFMALLVGLAVVAVRRRQPLSWLAYAGASLVVLLSAQVTDSLGRYGLVVVPFVVALAQWAERRWQQVAVGVLSCAGLVWLTSEAWLGRLVP